MKRIILSVIAVGLGITAEAQNVGIGTATPTEKLHVQGGGRITSLSGVGNRLVQSNATGVLSNIAGGTNGQVLTQTAGGPLWQNPVSDDWKLLGNAGTSAATNFVGTTDAVALNFRSNNLIRQTLSLTEAVFNENSYNYDFRIESDGQDDMFFVDASTNRIGINTLTPASPLQFITTGENVWLMQWDNTSINGAAARFQNTPTGNANRCLMGTTNYSGSTNVASAVIGISLNNTTTGTGGVGVFGSANNESGNAVEGSLYFVGGYTGWAGYFNGDVFSGGAYLGSDERLKKDVKPINSALTIIEQLNPVSYYYDTDKYPGIGYDEGRLTHGFIAQELETVLPELVKEKNIILNSNIEKTADMTGEEREVQQFKVVNYTGVIPILTQAIKEQQVIIESQQEEINELKSEIEAIKAILQNQ